MASHQIAATRLITPSTVIPELVVQQSQVSGFSQILGDGRLMNRLKPGDKMLYLRAVQMRGMGPNATQGSTMSLPSVEIIQKWGGTPVYLLQSGDNFDHHDQQAFDNANIPLQNALDLAHYQGFYQQLRNMALFGWGGIGGILPNVTVVQPGADAFGNTTISSYSPGQMALNVIAANASALAQAMFMLGTTLRVVALLPQRWLSQLQVEQVVQLFSYQMPGGGVVAPGKMAELQCANVNLMFEFAVDDTLKNAGVVDGNGIKKDIMLLTIPELQSRALGAGIDLNTNKFAELAPNLTANNIQAVDRTLPTKITSPLPRGATDLLYELSATAGFAVRPEASVAIEMAYQ